MEALTALASNGWLSLATVIVIIVILIFAIKTGLISFRGKGLSIGGAETEAKIRNMQQMYAKSLFEATISDLPAECEYYHRRFVISQCLDEVERMIRENHITSDECYIDTEFQIIYNIVILNTSLDYFRSDAFQKYLKELITKLVKQLESIRKSYN
jgi:hypothetical protein